MAKRTVIHVLTVWVVLATAIVSFTGCTEGGDGDGSILLTTEVVTDAGDKYILEDFAEWTVTLACEGEAPSVRDYPLDGEITSLAAGNYTVTVSDFGDVWVPAFDDPRYSGSATVAVGAGKRTDAEITALQTNAGVAFEFDDDALEASGVSTVVPTVMQGDHALVHSSDKRDAVSYFHTREAIVSFDTGSETVTIDDMTLHLTAGITTICVTTEPKSGLSLSITVVYPDEPTFEEEWKL